MSGMKHRNHSLKSVKVAEHMQFPSAYASFTITFKLAVIKDYESAFDAVTRRHFNIYIP